MITFEEWWRANKEYLFSTYEGAGEAWDAATYRVVKAIEARIQSLSYRSGDELAGAAQSELESLLREIKGGTG